MKLPDWLNPALKGAAAGAIAVAIIGFTWGGWVTGSTARQMATDRSRTDVVDALTTSVCMEMSKRDPMSAQKIVELKAASSYSRADLVMKSGWATMPGTTEPNRDVASACGAKLSI